MKRTICILLVFFINACSVDLTNVSHAELDSHDGFSLLINNHKAMLSKSSQCIGFLNKSDSTISDLVASFLAWPSENSNSKYFIHSQCKKSKHEITSNIIDILDCSLTVTEEIKPITTESVHVIATLRFFIDKRDNSLIKDSLICL